MNKSAIAACNFDEMIFGLATYMSKGAEKGIMDSKWKSSTNSRRLKMQSLNLKSLTWIRLVTAVCALGMAGMLTGCAVSGYQTVMNRVVVPGGATQNVHVDCPAGKKVLGGGFNIETPDDVRIFSSDPSDGHGNLIDHGWDVMVHNTGTQGRQTTAIAICAQ